MANPSEPKFTKGPWEVEGSRIVKFGPDHAAICLICEPTFGKYVSDAREINYFDASDSDRDAASANARLISAAPDLYEALQAFMDADRQRGGFAGKGTARRKAQELTEAALKKAGL